MDKSYVCINTDMDDNYRARGKAWYYLREKIHTQYYIFSKPT